MKEYEDNLRTYVVTSIEGNLDICDKLPIFLKLNKTKKQNLNNSNAKMAGNKIDTKFRRLSLQPMNLKDQIYRLHRTTTSSKFKLNPELIEKIKNQLENFKASRNKRINGYYTDTDGLITHADSMSSAANIKQIDIKSLDEYFVVKPRQIKKVSSTKRLQVSNLLNKDIPLPILSPQSSSEISDLKPCLNPVFASHMSMISKITNSNLSDAIRPAASSVN